ncbi:MAG: HD-GYP domain-containing protein [Phycisphaerales bacterium]
MTPEHTPDALPEAGSTVYESVRAVCARCQQQRVPVVVLTTGGRVVDIRADDPAADAALRSEAFARSAGAALVKSGTSPALIEASPGVRMGFVHVTDDLGSALVVAPVFLDSTTSPIPRETEQAAYGLLRASIEDLVLMQRHAGDIENFTGQLSHAYDTIDLLYTLGRSMGHPNSPKEFLASLCARTRSVMGFSWVAACFAADGDIPAPLRNVTAVDGDLFADLASCRSLLMSWAKAPGNSLSIHDRVEGLGGTGGQVISLPLLLRDKAVGVLAAGGKRGADPMVSSYDTQLFEACAGFLGTFLDNVSLYDNQKQLFMGTLQALTGAIDAKDRYTCGHSERVSVLSWQLAEAAGLPADEAERVRIAGLVHDVGKIGVPDAVLTKPGKLTDEEFGAIKLHPEIGHRILMPVPQLRDVLPGVLHHHERYDGRGYPHRIAGEDIPLMARIIAVADTFDAMSSDRSYRKRLSRDHVLAEIARSGGTQLDPRLAVLMVRLDLGLYDEMTLRHAAEASPGEKKAA